MVSRYQSNNEGNHSRHRIAVTLMCLLTGAITSPTVRRAASEFLTAYSHSRHVTYEAVSHAAISDAYRRLYGQAFIPTYHFDRAQTIVSFDADFLGTWISPVEYTRQYATARQLDGACLEYHGRR